MNKPSKKLSLSKTTIKNLAVRTNVQAGGIVAPPLSEGHCSPPPSGYTKQLCQW